jgi:glycosyltransferase involved in cell wall biosynthesis
MRPTPDRGARKPRVHWVSPLPPAETDIGHYTARILPELAAATDLTLWTDADHWDRALAAHCPVRQLDPDGVLPRDLTGRGTDDVVFIHIGNSWVYHSGFLRLAQRLPSIIVLHDLAIQELCNEAILNDRFDRDVYRAGMTRWYGQQGRDLADKLLDGKMGALDVAMTAPGFELTLGRATGVLSHTPAAFDAATARDFVPVYQLDLPFRPSATAPTAERAQAGPLRFAQFGYIGPNRRLDAVLDALSAVRHDIDFQFDIMGNVWDPSYIRDRIEELDLTDRVKIHGFVSEPQLDECLRQAHLIFNLRYPTMGEASGSQLRIWNASAASVVSDLGWYGSLPDETVFKISREDEHKGLVKLLNDLNADRHLGRSIGTAGRARLEVYHTPALYAAGIAQVASYAQEDTASALLARRARHLLEGMVDEGDLLKARLASRLSR